MSGVELLRRVRSKNSDIPFILVADRADKAAVLEAKDAGVSTLVAMPFTAALLEAKLRASIAKHLGGQLRVGGPND